MSYFLKLMLILAYQRGALGSGRCDRLALTGACRQKQKELLMPG
jgi:hypothetical protein